MSILSNFGPTHCVAIVAHAWLQRVGWRLRFKTLHTYILVNVSNASWYMIFLSDTLCRYSGTWVVSSDPLYFWWYFQWIKCCMGKFLPIGSCYDDVSIIEWRWHHIKKYYYNMCRQHSTGWQLGSDTNQIIRNSFQLKIYVWSCMYSNRYS